MPRRCPNCLCLTVFCLSTLDHPRCNRHLSLLTSAYNHALLGTGVPNLVDSGRITERLPWEVLESICNQYEESDLEDDARVNEASDKHFVSHPVPESLREAALAAADLPSECIPWPGIPLAQHKKNRFVLSMTHVCKSWRFPLIGVKRLWRNIAFSTDTVPTGLRLATFFLNRVADDTISLHIYAGLPFGDVLEPAIGVLLESLRQKIDRWEIFFYSGRLGPYRPYLDRAAPSLLHFSDSHDLCHIYFRPITQLFAGETGKLQSLTTSRLGDWPSTNLTGLRTLDLWDCAPEFSIELLLNALRGAQQIEEINIVSPNPPLLDCPPDEVVVLPCLKTLKIRNPDFYTIIEHFVIPNVETVYLYSSSNRGTDGLVVGRAFQISHPFVGLASMTGALPMFGRPILLCSLNVDPTSSGLRFAITITTEDGVVLCLDVEWTGGFGVHAQLGYIRNSMSALASMPFRQPSILRLTVRPNLINYRNPLFRLDSISWLVVEGERFMTVMNILGTRPGQSLFPNLRYLIFVDERLDANEIKMIPKLLRLRKNLFVVMELNNQDLIQKLQLSRACIIEGEFISMDIALS